MWKEVSTRRQCYGAVKTDCKSPDEEEGCQVLEVLAKDQLHILTRRCNGAKDLLPKSIGEVCSVSISSCTRKLLLVAAI